MGNSISPEGFGAWTKAEEVARAGSVFLRGRTFLITGANSGIGRETARVLLRHGATVVLACRTQPTIESIVTDVMREEDEEESTATNSSDDTKPVPPDAATGSETASEEGERSVEVVVPRVAIDRADLLRRIRILWLDLSSLESVRTFVREFEATGSSLHCLINNAGVMMLPEYELTVDGLERHFAINHLGHFLLTTLLLPTLIRSAIAAEQPSRIVTVSGHALEASWPFNVAHIPPPPQIYSSWAAYGFSKLCNVLMSNELHRRFSEYGILACSLHPGVIHTNLGRHHWAADAFYAVAKPLTKTIAEGAATTVYCAIMPGIVGSVYYSDCNPYARVPEASNISHGKLLWQASERLVQEKTHLVLSQVLREWNSAAGTLPVDEEQFNTRKPNADLMVEREQWMSDDSSSTCLLCDRAFTFTTRRSHCRFCGMLVCRSCSRNKMQEQVEVKGEKLHVGFAERCCDLCWCARHWQ